jgi:uncharacterized cupredoxin-like copper-binding protein
MRHAVLFFATASLAAPMAAQPPEPAQQVTVRAPEPEWRQAAQLDVLLAPFGYEPREIRLEAGRPVKLRFVNQGQGTYSFAAPAFFNASRVRAGDDAEIAGGSLRLQPGERKTVSLVPTAGRYQVRSSNFFHRLLGMRGVIVVE